MRSSPAYSSTKFNASKYVFGLFSRNLFFSRPGNDPTAVLVSTRSSILLTYATLALAGFPTLLMGGYLVGVFVARLLFTHTLVCPYSLKQIRSS